MTKSVLLLEPLATAAAEISTALAALGTVAWTTDHAEIARPGVDLVIVGPGVSVRAARDLCRQAAALTPRPLIVCISHARSGPLRRSAVESRHQSDAARR